MSHMCQDTAGVRSKCERPITRYQPPDWHARNAKLAHNAYSTRNDSHNLRKEAQLLKIETDTKTKWHNYENNMRLSERTQDIERWRKQLEKTLNEVNSEIGVLQEAKESCERAYEAKALPHDVVTECLSIRECRRQYDVVRDPVEHSLNDENLLLEKCRTVLKQKCEDSFDKLRDLEEIKQKLEIDLQDKTEALRIDIDQLELTERSTGLSHKPDPLKVPTGSVQPQAWHDHSADNKAQAESDMAKSQRLRENIFHSIEQTTNDLKVQTDATNFEFRKRMYEMKRAKEELEYQIRKTEEEMDEQERVIQELERALNAKINPLKLAETRLENRKMRPHMDLCADVPMEGLHMEVQAIQESMQLLSDKLDHARELLTELSIRHNELKEDHQRKSLALSLDTKCMGVRDKLPSHDSQVKNQCDRNVKMTGTLRNASRFLENSTVCK